MEISSGVQLLAIPSL